jgi:hypothetical protein
MTRSILKLTIIFACTLSSCNAREDAPGQSRTDETQAAPGSATGDPAVVHHPEPPARPDTKRDSIQLEGTWEPITATLVKPQASLPFSTYVPDDMAFEQNSADEGEGYYFFAEFGGQKNENAFMLVFILPQGSSAADAQSLGSAFIASRSGAGRIANVRYGEYNGRFFYVAHAYPAEFGDGMGPRTHFIRTNWVWLNDGRSLESTLQPQRG